jgi:C4-dicarboxylate transporter/malic acid transport protein
LFTRSLIFSDTWATWLSHPVQSLFFGCIPMGLVTIINGFIFWAPDFIGLLAFNIAACLWWVAVALSLISAFLVPYYMFTRQQHEITNMTALWLLPFVACEVSAGAGGLLMPHLAPTHELAVFIISLILWSISIFLALSILVIYLQRLFIHKLPAVEMAATIWLPLGPTATAALAILLIGNNAYGLKLLAGFSQLFPLLEILPAICLLLGIIFWGLASWWLMMALIGTIHYLQHKPKFSLGFWGYIFPLGVYAMATAILGKDLHSAFFTHFSYVLIVSLFFLWLIISLRTLYGVYHANSKKRDEILKMVA